MCENTTDYMGKIFDFICKFFAAFLLVNIICMFICLGCDWSVYPYFAWIIPFVSKIHDKATEWVAIFGAVWGITTTIAIFIFGKFNEITYGITLRDFLDWKIKSNDIRNFFIEYCFSLILLMVCYFKEWYITFLYLQIVNVLELFGLIGFILIYVRRKEIYKEIKKRTQDELCKNLSDAGKAKNNISSLPFITMLQTADYNKDNDIKRIIDILTDVCILITYNNPIQNHVILKHIIIYLWNSQILDSIYRLNNMVDLIHMLLQNVEKELNSHKNLSERDMRQEMTAVTVGILITLVESGVFIEYSKNFSDIINTLPDNFRKNVKILTLLYAEYLACHNDKNKQRDFEINKLNLWEIYPYSMEDREYFVDMDSYWYAWNIDDGHLNHHIDWLYHFKTDYLHLRKTNKFGHSYIISKLKLFKG